MAGKPQPRKRVHYGTRRSLQSARPPTAEEIKAAEDYLAEIRKKKGKGVVQRSRKAIEKAGQAPFPERPGVGRARVEKALEVTGRGRGSGYLSRGSQVGIKAAQRYLRNTPRVRGRLGRVIGLGKKLIKFIQD